MTDGLGEGCPALWEGSGMGTGTAPGTAACGLSLEPGLPGSMAGGGF